MQDYLDVDNFLVELERREANDSDMELLDAVDSDDDE
jgi:hypothetical protein